MPLLLAGLGEQISEKAGVLNIGIEGMMLAGAYAGFLGAYQTGSLWLGFLDGLAGGAAVALVMALLCVRLGLNQIVIGIALTLGAEGLTALLHHFQFSQPIRACRVWRHCRYRGWRRSRHRPCPVRPASGRLSRGRARPLVLRCCTGGRISG